MIEVTVRRPMEREPYQKIADEISEMPVDVYKRQVLISTKERSSVLPAWTETGKVN